MLSTLSSLNYLHIAIITVVGYLIGAIWYGALFGKMWMAEMKITPEMAKDKSGMAGVMVRTLVLTFVSTVTLACLIVQHASLGYKHGAYLGLFVGVGLIAARQLVNGAYEKRSCRLLAIVAFHDIVLCAVQGALLAHWH